MKPFTFRSAKWKRSRPMSHIGLAAAIVPILVCGSLAYWEPFGARALRDIVFDLYQRWSPRPYDPEVPVRVIAIDDESLTRIGQWPWPRERIAELIERLTKAGAATIAVDVLFSEPERSQGERPGSGDQRLAEAIGPANLVLGTTLADQGAPPPAKAGFSHAGADPRPFLPRFNGALLPIEPLRQPAAGLGAMNFVPDRDLVVRELPTLFNAAGEFAPTLAMEALRLAQGASSYVTRSGDASGDSDYGEAPGMTAIRVGNVEALTARNGSIRIRYAGTHAERRLPAWQVFEENFDAKPVQGAIVFVGATASALYDLRATPLEPNVPGIDIHAEMIESIIAGAQLTRPDFMRGLETVLVIIGGLFGLSAASRLAPLSGAVVTAMLVAAFAGTSALAFTSLQQLFDPLWPSAATLGSFGVAGVSVLRQTERERRQVREAFAHYLSPAVVESLARDPSRLVLGGETRVLTVMFSDIRGFTSRSETLSAEDVVGFLNSIHTPLTQHVLDTAGTLDKFMGDGMMAFWNAPVEVPDHVRAALRCALQMQRTVEVIGERLGAEAAAQGRSAPPLSIGIGIHTGPACVGNVGSEQRFDYSAIGDTVNAAARIEPLCKTFKVGILVSEAVVEAAPEFAALYIGSVALRGRQSETQLFALHGDDTAVTEAFKRFRQQHDEAVRLCGEDDARGFQLLEQCARDPLGQAYRGFYENLLAKRTDPLILAAS
jgi:adenylate cyclase